MDKTKLRKEVNALRSLVKKTRTNIIRKLLRDRKQWSYKLAKAGDNQRAKKKHDSIVAIADHLKALRTSQLVKHILNNVPPAKSVGSGEPPGSITDRVVARFRADKNLASRLAAFRQEFGVLENAPGKLLNISKKRKAEKKVKPNKTKKEKDGTEKTKAKTKKGKVKKKKVVQRKNKSSSDEESEDDRSDLDVSISESEGSSSEGETGASDDDAEEPAAVKKKTENSAKVKEPAAAKQTSKQAVKKKPNNTKPPEEDDDESDFEYVTDSFFITADGRDYVAVAPKWKVPDDEEEEEEESDEEPWRLANKRKRKQEQSGELPVVENKKERNERNKWPQEESNQHQTSQKLDEDLHPSWAAKQRQKGLKPFAGKKIVFAEENGDPVSNGEPAKTDLHPSWVAKQKQKGLKPFAGKKIVFDEDNGVAASKKEPAEDLHPSWAAKQAQKGIKPFAGKRMVFDDTNVASSQPKAAKPADTDLHPSWAAKQAQKEIKPFAGKKIVFDTNGDGDSGSGLVSAVRQPPSAKPASDLHPSWAAKQAQKGIKPFSGKRVVFDGESTTNGMVPTVRPGPFTKAAASDLHPSWAAKQSQQGIKPFAGKKIVFNDDDTSGQDKSAFRNEKPANDVHPSWAAKQAQKGIKPFAGKKITFGVDTEETVHRSFNKSQASGDATHGSIKKNHGNGKVHSNGVQVSKSSHSIPSDVHPSWAAKQAQKGIKPFEGKKISFDD